jgi:hypothetical protein
MKTTTDAAMLTNLQVVKANVAEVWAAYEQAVAARKANPKGRAEALALQRARAAHIADKQADAAQRPLLERMQSAAL